MNQRQIEILEIFTDAGNYASHRPVKIKQVRLPKYEGVTEKRNHTFHVPTVTNSDLYDIHLQLQLQNNPRIKSKCR